MNHLLAQPTEEIWDGGPKHRGSAGNWILTVLSLVVTGLFLLGWSNETDKGVAPVLLVAALLFGAFTAWGAWCLVDANSGHRECVPGAHYVLAEQLKFIITRTINDVAVTAFFRPDAPGAGGATSLLIFLENYSSRRRDVRIQFGSCAALELPRSARLELTVLAGQAAVYRWPLRVYPDAKPREYEVKLQFTIKAPTGLGRVLPAFSGKKHKSTNTAMLTRAATQLHPTLTVAAGGAGSAATPAEPAFLALASPVVSQPRFEILRQIAENSPDQPINISGPTSAVPWSTPTT